MAESADDQIGVNVVVLRGRLSRVPDRRRLPSGDVLVSLDVTTRLGGGAVETVPVAVLDPPRLVSQLDAGDLVVVAGRVRRRFYRADGATRSRTEVLADRVVPARHRVRARSAIDRILAAGGLLDDTDAP